MADRGASDAWDTALRRPADLLRGAGAPSFASRLDRWVADARVDEAALQRSRERWLREVAEQEATLSGVLSDLAERRAGVSISAGSRLHHGMIQAIGVDFVALRDATGTDVLLTIAAVGTVRVTPSSELAVGDRMVATELRLVDVLIELAADRERVRVVTTDGEAVAGGLRSVGHDLVVLRADGDPVATCYVPIAAVAEVAIR